MATPTETLIQEGSCFSCAGASTVDILALVLWDRISQGIAPMACANLTGVAPDPNGIITPDFVGQVYVTSGAVWQATDLTNTGWVLICSAGLVWGPSPATVDEFQPGGTFLAQINNRFNSSYTELTFAQPTTINNGIDWSGDNDIISLTWQLLASVGADLSINSSPSLQTLLMNSLASIGGDSDFSTNTSLTNFGVTSLVTIGGSLSLNDCSAFTTLSLPALTSIGSDFICSNNVVMASVSVPLLATIGGSLLFNNCVLLASLNLPALTSIVGNVNLAGDSSLTPISVPLLATIGGDLNFNSNTALAAFALPSLTSIGGGVNGSNCTSLVSFSATNLGTTGQAVIFQSSTALVTVNLPNWLPTDGFAVDFSNCALDAASVNLILARCVAGGLTISNIDLSGGTSAAPTGQGITDKADLITAGNTVTTN